MQMIQHQASAKLRPCGRGNGRPAVQRRIAGEAAQPAGVALWLLRIRLQLERQLSAAHEKAGEVALLGEAHVLARSAHAAGSGRRARQQTRWHVPARQLHVVEHLLEWPDRARPEQRGANRRCIETRQFEQAARERVVALPRGVEPGEP